MKVCIAEKPSVAKEIAEIIGAKARKDGFYEGNGYQVTWTFGHFCTLKEPDDYDKSLKRWGLFSLPVIPEKFGIKLIENDGVQKQFGTIKNLVSQAEEIINCGDAGQEGELIQRWVLQMAGNTKPVKRLWISSLTEQAIRDGFKSLKEGSDYDRLYWAGSSRAIGDWLLGINATRLYTVKYGQQGSVLSIGRVQTPTLAMIVNRHKEIENFVSKPFWELKTKYRDVAFNATVGKQYEKEKADSLLAGIENKPFEITSFEKKEGKENCPKLYDLTSLQVECNKKFNLGAEETLKVAQSLYEKKFVTYPRVDTRYLPEDQYPAIEGILKSLNRFQALVDPLIGKPIKKSKSVFNDKKITDHHAIIPTNVSVGSVTEIEQKVYDLIAKRFIANFYPECIVSKTTVLGKVEEVDFRTTGKQIISPGWRGVYGKEKVDEEGKKKDEDESTQLLPNFEKGESGPHQPFTEEKITNPPKYYTEATLLRAMETAGKQVDDEELRDLMKENGIGRPATRANIIQTLFRRKYVVLQRKNLVPTVTGVGLIDTIQNDLLKSAELTGKWEKNLRGIELGSYGVKQFMWEMKTMVSQLVQEVKDSNFSKIDVHEDKKPVKKAKAKNDAPIKCPKCNEGKIMKGKSAYGCTNFKNGCSLVLPFVQQGKKLTDTQLKALFIKSRTPEVKGVEVEGKKVSGHFVLEKDFSVQFHVKEEAPLICPKCNKGKILKGSKAYGCAEFRNGCNFVVPFMFGEKKLTEKQIELLIRKGKTGKIKDIGVLGLNREFRVEVLS